MMNTNHVLMHYLLDCLEILRTSVILAQMEKPMFYRVAAVQLRILLCDTTRVHDRSQNTALVPLLFPECWFDQLDDQGEPLPGRTLLLDAWLEQIIPGMGQWWTIRRLIRSVSDQDGGAHVDLRRPSRDVLPEERVFWVMQIGKLITRVLDKEIDKAGVHGGLSRTSHTMGNASSTQPEY